MANPSRRYPADEAGGPEREGRIFVDHTVLRWQSVESSSERRPPAIDAKDVGGGRVDALLRHEQGDLSSGGHRDQIHRRLHEGPVRKMAARRR